MAGTDNKLSMIAAENIITEYIYILRYVLSMILLSM